MDETIKRMTAECHSDAAIAEHLTAAGHRSPRAEKVLESTVRLNRLPSASCGKLINLTPVGVVEVFNDPPVGKKARGQTLVD